MKSIDELVSQDVITALKNTIVNLSVAQRNEFNIRKEDIYFAFPYQIGIIFDDDSDVKPQKRYVEITMVYHVLKGLKELQDSENPPPLNMASMPEYRKQITICNYRFIKEYTQGNESDWTINIVNHFKPSDYIDE